MAVFASSRPYMQWPIYDEAQSSIQGDATKRCRRLTSRERQKTCPKRLQRVEGEESNPSLAHTFSITACLPDPDLGTATRGPLPLLHDTDGFISLLERTFSCRRPSLQWPFASRALRRCLQADLMRKFTTLAAALGQYVPTASPLIRVSRDTIPASDVWRESRR